MAQVPDPRTVIKLVEEYRDEWEIPPDADDFRPSDGATNVQVSKLDFQPGEPKEKSKQSSKKGTGSEAASSKVKKKGHRRTHSGPPRLEQQADRPSRLRERLPSVDLQVDTQMAHAMRFSNRWAAPRQQNLAVERPDAAGGGAGTRATQGHSNKATKRVAAVNESPTLMTLSNASRLCVRGLLLDVEQRRFSAVARELIRRGHSAPGEAIEFEEGPGNDSTPQFTGRWSFLRRLSFNSATPTATPNTTASSAATAATSSVPDPNSSTVKGRPSPESGGKDITSPTDTSTVMLRCTPALVQWLLHMYRKDHSAGGEVRELMRSVLGVNDEDAVKADMQQTLSDLEARHRCGLLNIPQLVEALTNLRLVPETSAEQPLGLQASLTYDLLRQWCAGSLAVSQATVKHMKASQLTSLSPLLDSDSSGHISDAEDQTPAILRSAPGRHPGAARSLTRQPSTLYEYVARFRNRPNYKVGVQLESVDHVWCISDVHTDFKENMAWVSSLPVHHLDAIMICGNISTSLGALHRTLKLFSRRFKHVFFVFGNQDLWTIHYEGDSVEKFFDILDLCDSLGVHTAPALLGNDLAIIPLFSWYTTPSAPSPTAVHQPSPPTTTSSFDSTAAAIALAGTSKSSPPGTNQEAPKAPPPVRDAANVATRSLRLGSTASSDGTGSSAQVRSTGGAADQPAGVALERALNTELEAVASQQRQQQQEGQEGQEGQQQQEGQADGAATEKVEGQGGGNFHEERGLDGLMSPLPTMVTAPANTPIPGNSTALRETKAATAVTAATAAATALGGGSRASAGSILSPRLWRRGVQDFQCQWPAAVSDMSLAAGPPRSASGTAFDLLGVNLGVNFDVPLTPKKGQKRSFSSQGSGMSSTSTTPRSTPPRGTPSRGTPRRTPSSPRNPWTPRLGPKPSPSNATDRNVTAGGEMNGGLLTSETTGDVRDSQRGVAGEAGAGHGTGQGIANFFNELNREALSFNYGKRRLITMSYFCPHPRLASKSNRSSSPYAPLTEQIRQLNPVTHAYGHGDGQNIGRVAALEGTGYIQSTLGYPRIGDHDAAAAGTREGQQQQQQLDRRLMLVWEPSYGDFLTVRRRGLETSLAKGMAVIKHCRNHRAVTRSLALDLANGLLVLTHKNSVASSKPKVYELSSMHRVDPGRTTDVFRASWRRRVNDDRCLSLYGDWAGGRTLDIEFLSLQARDMVLRVLRDFLNARRPVDDDLRLLSAHSSPGVYHSSLGRSI